MSEDHKHGYREALLQGHNYEKITWGAGVMTDDERHEVEEELGLREPAPKPEPVPEPEAKPATAPKEAAKHAEKAARTKAAPKKPAAKKK
jgi:hypothetical protein